MKANRFISTMLLPALWLSVAVQHGQAQQPASTTSQTETAAEAISKPSPSALLAQVSRGKWRVFGLNPSSRYLKGSIFHITPAAALQTPAVHGSGTVGKISMWTATGPSGNSILGDSIITQSSGNIGIGTDSPTSKLTVQGMIETTLGGYKFPDGTVQTTAGLTSIFHDSTLAGDGTAASPLGVAVPLSLIGVVPFPDDVVTIMNVLSNVGGLSGNTLRVFGAESQSGVGGTGVTVSGGHTHLGGTGGIAVRAHGGGTATTNGVGNGGIGVQASGGNVGLGSGGVGVFATGGSIRTSGSGGDGVVATGGNLDGFGDDELTRGGNGLVATGGNARSECRVCEGGHGIVATGGNRYGIGVVATGGIGGDDRGQGPHTTRSAGVVATGGAALPGLQIKPGIGVIAKGGPANGPGTRSGVGLVVGPGDADDGATPGLAAHFFGGVVMGDLEAADVTVFNDLTVHETKNFKIDHPLDPENKYLLHASVESSEVLNVYSGNVTTNEKGEATVALPEWFEALNRDLRYQLTVIGTFAQAIVAEKVKQNRFTIRTSAPNVEVSWQVTGVRSDRAMQKHPFKAVEVKPESERGTYLDPELFNQPEERSVRWARNPELMRQMKGSRISQVEEMKPKVQSSDR
jgi:hypothetical protein